jgi:hypothetical protein
LGPLLNKALKYYLEVKDIPKTFEDIAPEYYKKTSAEYCENVDVLFQFLNQPDHIGKDGICYGIEFNADYYELLSAVEYKFQMYCAHMRLKPAWARGDYSVFHKFNCKVEPAHICKACSKRSKSGCCPKYSVENRKKLIIVKGLHFVSEKVENLIISDSGARSILGV